MQDDSSDEDWHMIAPFFVVDTADKSLSIGLKAKPLDKLNDSNVRQKTSAIQGSSELR